MFGFELPKLSDIESLETVGEQDFWLALFNAETVEELERLVEI